MTINPWNVQPLTSLDDSKEKTYASIGHALSEWEYLELQLSAYFGFFCGGHDPIIARRAYGCVISFQGRAEMLRAAAEAYFNRYSDDDLSKRFSDLVNSTNRYSARRNEIAHGIVMPLFHDNNDGQGYRQRGWALVASEYATKKNELLPLSDLGFQDTRFTYAYSSKEIEHYATQFIALGKEAIALMDWWADRHPLVASPSPIL